MNLDFNDPFDLFKGTLFAPLSSGWWFPRADWLRGCFSLKLLSLSVSSYSGEQDALQTNLLSKISSRHLLRAALGASRFELKL